MSEPQYPRCLNCGHRWDYHSDHDVSVCVQTHESATRAKVESECAQRIEAARKEERARFVAWSLKYAPNGSPQRMSVFWCEFEQLLRKETP